MLKKTIKYIAASALQHFHRNSSEIANCPSISILTYHRVLPRSHSANTYEQAGMVVTPETLDKHIQWLKARYEIIPLSSWPKLCSGKNQKRYAAITFDDGWKDNFDYALSVLAKHQVPYTIFLVADLIGSAYSFWPTDLAALLINRPVLSKKNPAWLSNALNELQLKPSKFDRDTIDSLITHFKDVTDEEMLLRLSELQLIYPATGNDKADLMNAGEILEFINTPLAEPGSHTCKHIRLNNKIAIDTLQYEVIKSKEKLKSLTNKNIDIFCYPNGEYCDSSVKIVSENYLAAVTTEQGVNTYSTDVHLLKRFSMHEDGSSRKALFYARLNNWF